MKISFLILLLLSAIDLSARHPLHISMVNLELQNDSAIFSVRLFYDDFQALINNKYNTFIDFAKDSRLTTKEQRAISDYINRSLQIENAGEMVCSARFLRWRVEELSVWLFFACPFSATDQEITIKNLLMLDLFNDQKNLLILTSGGSQQGIEFDNRTTSQHLQIQ